MWKCGNKVKLVKYFYFKHNFFIFLLGKIEFLWQRENFFLTMVQKRAVCIGLVA